MIAYFDTSALVPLVIEEPTTAACGRIWDAADRRVSVRLAFVETAAALAMALRIGRIAEPFHEAAFFALDELWAAMDVIEVDADLARAAASAAHEWGLRAYDAVHHAAAASLDDAALVAVAGDAALLASWRGAGLAVGDVNAT